MIRRVLKTLKPFSLALLVLALLPCVLEFGMRLSACRSGFRSVQTLPDVSVVPSWQTHHQLEPFQAIDRPAADARQPGQTIEFRTNSLGLRGSEPAVPKPRDVYRVICVGDETVLAPEIDEASTFCKVLERRLQALSGQKVEVINAGIPDFCPLLSFLQVKHRLAGLAPDLIIAHFDMTDVWDDRRFRRLTDLGEAEQPLVCAHPGLNNEPRTLPLTENFLLWKWAQSNIGGIFGGVPDRPGDVVFGDPRTKFDWLTDEIGEWALPLDLTLSAWDHLAGYCRSRGTPLLFAVHPAPWQISATASRGARIPEANGVYPGAEYDSETPFERIREFVRERQMPLCDVSTAMRSVRNPDALFQLASRGFSRSGHELYAAQLHSAIRLVNVESQMRSSRPLRQVSWPSDNPGTPGTRANRPATDLILETGPEEPVEFHESRPPGTAANSPRRVAIPNDLAPISRQQ